MITEFYCDECKGNNTINLLEDLNGLHIIKCGKCSHDHYRIIREGTMTDLRFPEESLKRYKLNAFTYNGKWNKKSWERDHFLSECWANLSEVI